MWRMTPRFATAALFATLALIASYAPQASASTVQSYSYSTYGNIAEVSGATPVTFSGVTGNSNSLTTPGTFSLGQFVTNPLPSSGTVTYNNTPFTVNLWVTDLHVPGQLYPGALLANSDYTVSGMLNGSVTGTGASTMVATVTSITGADYGTMGSPPFPISSLIVAPQGITAPNGSTMGFTTLTAQVATPTAISLPAPAPEPTSVAAFAAAIAGWVIRRKFKNKGSQKAIDGDIAA